MWKKKINIVLNFDTGIGRDGIQIEEIDQLNLEKCKIELIMSHLSCSEQKEHFLNKEQLKSFRKSKICLLEKNFHYRIQEGYF